jgi:hypothetical protein
MKHGLLPGNRGLALTALLAVACTQRPSSEEALSSAQAEAVQSAVRGYLEAVATDVSREGPAAWRRHFSDGPVFFMAVNGQLAFPDGAAAAKAIPELVHSLPRIQLRFSDVRVDALTARLAVVAASYQEATVDAQGKHADERGYFTGTVESRDGHWQFRNAHWSSLLPPVAPGP